jgi:hypothetical protein
MAEEQNVNTSIIVTIGVVSATIVLVIIIALQAWFYEAYDEESARKADQEINWKLTDLRLEHQENITTYRWIDQQAGSVRIPVDRAIELWLDRQAKATEGQVQP